MRAFFEFCCWIILLGMLCCLSLAHASARKLSSGLKVVVIDTGLDIADTRLNVHLCFSGHKDFTGKGLQDDMGHGTHVVGLIEKYAGDNYCLVILKFAEDGAPQPSENYYMEALREAVSQSPDIVNLSISGGAFDEEEDLLMCEHPEILFMVAAGNNGQNLDLSSSYPASVPCPNVRAIGARAAFSNYGSKVRQWEDGVDVLSTLPHNQMGTMSGTSMSCAIATGKRIYEATHQSK